MREVMKKYSFVLLNLKVTVQDGGVITINASKYKVIAKYRTLVHFITFKHHPCTTIFSSNIYTNQAQIHICFKTETSCRRFLSCKHLV